MKYTIFAYLYSHSFPVPIAISFLDESGDKKRGFYLHLGEHDKFFVSLRKKDVLEYLHAHMQRPGTMIRVEEFGRYRGDFVAEEFGLTGRDHVIISTGYHRDSFTHGFMAI